MTKISSAVLGLSLTIASMGFAQDTKTPAKMDSQTATGTTAPAKKSAKKHKKAKTTVPSVAPAAAPSK